MIPKVIWTYWDTEELPEFIQKCVETWRYFNNEYEIIILNMNNYQKYTNIDVTKLRHYSKDKHQLTADYIRVIMLKEHGGVWMDASIICIKPIVFKADTEFFGYYKDNHGIMGNYKYPMIDNWFFASSKNNAFMNELYTEFIENTNNYYSMNTYVLLSNVEIKRCFINGYHAMYFSTLKTFKKLDQENRLPKMVLRHASIEGPLLDDHQITMIGELLCNTDFNKLRTPILKINRFGRDTIIKDKKIYECILKKIEHFGSDEYIEDLGYSNLDGNFQKPDKQLYTKNMSILIILFVATALIVIIALQVKKK